MIGIKLDATVRVSDASEPQVVRTKRAGMVSNHDPPTFPRDVLDRSFDERRFLPIDLNILQRRIVRLREADAIAIITSQNELRRLLRRTGDHAVRDRAGIKMGLEIRVLSHKQIGSGWNREDTRRSIERAHGSKGPLERRRVVCHAVALRAKVREIEPSRRHGRIERIRRPRRTLQRKVPQELVQSLQRRLGATESCRIVIGNLALNGCAQSFGHEEPLFDAIALRRS